MVLSAVIIFLSVLTLEVQKVTVNENGYAVTEGRFTDDLSVTRNENSTTKSQRNDSRYSKQGNEGNHHKENYLWKNYTCNRIKMAFGQKNNSELSVLLNNENDKANSTNPPERNVNTSLIPEKSFSDEHNSSFPSFENISDTLNDEGSTNPPEERNVSTRLMPEKSFSDEHNSSFPSFENVSNTLNDEGSTNPPEERNVSTSLTPEKSFSDEHNSSFPSFENVSDTLHDEGVPPDVFDWRRREDAYNLTKPEQYPYAVLVVMYSEEMRLGHCTGSIISESWVLTASHCLEKTEYTIVYAGGNSLTELDDFIDDVRPLAHTAQLLEAEKTIVHPLYGGAKFDCDVGLIKVKTKFKFTKYVRAVRLTSTPWGDSFHSYTSCVMTGFGMVQLGEHKRDNYRRKTNRLDVKNPCICSFRLQILFGSRTAHRYLCSRPRQDYGVCQGDSGGGLVCGDELRGVTMQMVRLDDTRFCDISFSGEIKCGGDNILSVFEDICPFLPWVNKHVKLFNESSPISRDCKYTASSPRNRSRKLLMLSNVFVVVMSTIKTHF